MTTNNSNLEDDSSQNTKLNDGVIIASLLKETGCDFSAAVVNKLLEFQYKYVSEVVRKAEANRQLKKEETINLKDAKMGIETVSVKQNQKPTVQDLKELSEKTNSLLLSQIKPTGGLRIPNNGASTAIRRRQQDNMTQHKQRRHQLSTLGLSRSLTPTKSGLTSTDAFKGPASFPVSTREMTPKPENKENQFGHTSTTIKNCMANVAPGSSLLIRNAYAKKQFEGAHQNDIAVSKSTMPNLNAVETTINRNFGS